MSIDLSIDLSVKSIILPLSKILIILLLSIKSFGQLKNDSINYRLDEVEKTLKGYGKQNVIADKITLVSIGVVGLGTIFNVKSTQMLVANSLCSLAILTISYKADLKLSKSKK